MSSSEKITGLLSHYSHAVELARGETQKVPRLSHSMLIVLGLTDLVLVQPTNYHQNAEDGYTLFNMYSRATSSDPGKTGTLPQIKNGEMPEVKMPHMNIELGKIAILGREATPAMGFSEQVSRRHAAIIVTADRSLFIHDEYSTNGTRLYLRSDSQQQA